MSVNYNSGGWKQTLDPIIQSRKEELDRNSPMGRKNTYSISSQDDKESMTPRGSSNFTNLGSQI